MKEFVDDGVRRREVPVRVLQQEGRVLSIFITQPFHFLQERVPGNSEARVFTDLEDPYFDPLLRHDGGEVPIPYSREDGEDNGCRRSRGDEMFLLHPSRSFADLRGYNKGYENEDRRQKLEVYGIHTRVERAGDHEPEDHGADDGAYYPGVDGVLLEDGFADDDGGKAGDNRPDPHPDIGETLILGDQASRDADEPVGDGNAEDLDAVHVDPRGARHDRVVAARPHGKAEIGLEKTGDGEPG